MEVLVRSENALFGKATIPGKEEIMARKKTKSDESIKPVDIFEYYKKDFQCKRKLQKNVVRAEGVT